jgi:hypothetical protein
MAKRRPVQKGKRWTVLERPLEDEHVGGALIAWGGRFLGVWRCSRWVAGFGSGPRALSHAIPTLDALHLTSLEFLRSHGQTVRLASYDERLLGAARRLGVEAHPL